jgi:hypothetical protein
VEVFPMTAAWRLEREASTRTRKICSSGTKPSIHQDC